MQRRSHLAAPIASRIIPDPETRQEAFTAGLLDDVGLFVLARQDPHELVAITDARASASAAHDVEYPRHGISHAELGALVLGLGCLP